MNKTRTLIALTTLICALGTAATPTHAWFQTTKQLTKGPIAKLPATATFNYEPGSAKDAEVVCENIEASKATGYWTIQDSKYITKTTTEQSQPATKTGQHEDITITNWGQCKTKIAGAPAVTANAKECRLQTEQLTKGGPTQTVTGSVQTICTIGAAGTTCTIKIAPEEPNHGLKTVLASNVGADGVEIFANVSNITAAAPGAACNIIGLNPTTTKASFKTGVGGGEPIILSLQKLI